MASIDIRTIGDEEITKIVFAELDEDYSNISYLEYDADHNPAAIFMHTSEDYCVVCRKDIENLIKALQKSLEIWKD